MNHNNAYGVLKNRRTVPFSLHEREKNSYVIWKFRFQMVDNFLIRRMSGRTECLFCLLAEAMILERPLGLLAKWLDTGRSVNFILLRITFN